MSPPHPTPCDPSAFEQVALALAAHLAPLALALFAQNPTPQQKADRSLVTAADLAIENAARAFLAQATPNTPVGGEEGGSNPSDWGDTWWLIDPIDGTDNFVARTPLWSTLIALIHQGRPVVGVVSLPALGEIFVAHAGGGARWGRLGPSGEQALLDPHPCQVAQVPSLSMATLSTTTPQMLTRKGMDAAFPLWLSQVRQFRTHSDAYGFTRLLKGGIHLMFDMGVQTWDLAPLQILFEETPGACFLSFEGAEGPHVWTLGSCLAASSRPLAEAFLALTGDFLQSLPPPLLPLQPSSQNHDFPPIRSLPFGAQCPLTALLLELERGLFALPAPLRSRVRDMGFGVDLRGGVYECRLFVESVGGGTFHQSAPLPAFRQTLDLLLKQAFQGPQPLTPSPYRGLESPVSVTEGPCDEKSPNAICTANFRGGQWSRATATNL